MKKADKPYVINITGDNNKVYVGGRISHQIAITVALFGLLVIAVLIVAHCCPEYLGDFVRAILHQVSNS